MFCTNCGEQMRDTDKFCAECGAPAPPRPRRNRDVAAEAAATPAVAAEPPAPPTKPVDARPVLKSTAEAFRVPLPSAAPTGAAPRQPELAFSASTPPTQVSQTPGPVKPHPAPLSREEQERALLEAEEMAAARGMVPVEALPDEFPAPAAKTAAPSYNPWLDTGPAPTPAPALRVKEVSPAAPTPSPARAAEATKKEESFFYFYDDATAPRQNRKLLVVLLVVFALGIAGLIFLMSRSPKKSAPSGEISISISPASADVVVGQAQDFAATVMGTGETDVIWSVDDGGVGGKVINRGAQAQGGKVAVVGVYVAPLIPGTYHVIAASKADPTKSASAEVLVSGK